MATCSKCGAEKSRTASGNFGCRPCNAAKGRRWRSKNPNSHRRYKRKPSTEADKQRKRKWYLRNKERISRNWKASYLVADKGPIREKHFLYKYGLSLEKYEAMVRSVHGLCAICGKPESRKRGGRVILLSVDHDRSCCNGTKSCGRCIRSPLCGKCNQGLGMFGDDPTALRAAADYIESHRRRVPLPDDVPSDIPAHLSPGEGPSSEGPLPTSRSVAWRV